VDSGVLDAAYMISTHKHSCNMHEHSSGMGRALPYIMHRQLLLHLVQALNMHNLAAGHLQ
jgi:hypothetical protein